MRADGETVGLASAGQGAERVYAHTVTLSYFGVLGVRPAAGRMLTDRDRAIVLSHAFWTRRFKQDPSVIGRSVRINGQPFVIAGVAAAAFRGTSLVATDAWTSIPRRPTRRICADATCRRLGARALEATRVGGQAAAEVETVGRTLEREYPAQNGQHGLRLSGASYIPGNLAPCSAASSYW